MKKKLLKVMSMMTNVFAMKAYADDTIFYTPPDPATRTDNLGEQVVHTVWSKEIEFQALPNMRFFQFAVVKTELGSEPGLTINMMTYDNLKRGGQLVETQKMKTQAMSGSVKSITVTEYGNAISVSEKLYRSAFDDTMRAATELLGRDYALVVDMELRDAALSGTNIVYARKKDETVCSARKDLTAENILKVSTIKDALEILASNNAPKVGGAYWICFVHPHQSRSLRDDPAWISAAQYGDPEKLFTGEIGRIDDTRFIETTILCNGAAAESDEGYKADLKKGVTPEGATDANPIDIYKAVLFGDAYYGIAFGLPVELRDNGNEDFQRTRSLAWYSIFGVGKLHDKYGVVLETA